MITIIKDLGQDGGSSYHGTNSNILLERLRRTTKKSQVISGSAGEIRTWYFTDSSLVITYKLNFIPWKGNFIFLYVQSAPNLLINVLEIFG
jgi:hypothetical protein